MTSPASQSHFSALLEIAARLERDYELKLLPSMWEASPFSWLKIGLTSTARGTAMRTVLQHWLADEGFAVRALKERQADFVVNGSRVKVKSSTLWQGRAYRFQQIKDQNYDILICFGLSPDEAHCWVLSKPLLLEQVIGQGHGQHTGAGATETFWLAVDPHHPQSWLRPRSGDLDQAHAVLRTTTAW